MISTEAAQRSEHNLHHSPEEDIRRGVLNNEEIYKDFSREQLTIGAMDLLEVKLGSERYFEAAKPGYQSPFPRDLMIAMSLRGDKDVLADQIGFVIRRQGTKQDPYSGQEPGKIPHELPGVEMNGRKTTYNACDTSALVLHAVASLATRGDRRPLEQYAENIAAAVSYIKRHVNKNGLFVEDPAYAGADNADDKRGFALKVTDWKDSELNREGSREPRYPIIYSLAHFQNANALKRIGQVTRDERLVRFGRYMTEAGIRYLWKNDHFVTAIDMEGVTDAPSTDSLHSLLYIDPEDLPPSYAKKVESYSKQLITPYGYRAGIPVNAKVDPYHMKVWTHEQALLSAAGAKQDLADPIEITRRVRPFIVPSEVIFPETIDPDTGQPYGNIEQLWAMGAELYFDRPERALL